MKTPASTLTFLPVPTADGTFWAGYSLTGLAWLEFPGWATRHETDPDAAPVSVTHWHKLTVAAVEAVLANRDIPAWPPLDLTRGTDFQRRIWEAIRSIPRGQTRSYGVLGTQIGQAGAARAVGGACGANPIPVLIPCHRVLAAGGALGGFTGELDWKRKLLAREGVFPTETGAEGESGDGQKMLGV